MILEEIKKVESSPRDLRNFGLIVGGIFCVLGIIFELRGKSFAHPALLVGILLVLGGILRPKILTYPHKIWMTLGIVLGFVVNKVLLTIFFYVGISPIAIVARLLGKRFLDVRFKTTDLTYWGKRTVSTDKAVYEKQF